MGHTFSHILVHVIFGTKGRKNSLYRDMRPKLLNYIDGILQKHEVEVLEANAVDDHVHLLLSVKPRHDVASLVRTMKANSCRWIHDECRGLGDFAWQSGYSVFSVSESARPTVEAYIRNQERHHHRLPFSEEIRVLLEKHKVKYDPGHYLE